MNAQEENLLHEAEPVQLKECEHTSEAAVQVFRLRKPWEHPAASRCGLPSSTSDVWNRKLDVPCHMVAAVMDHCGTLL